MLLLFIMLTKDAFYTDQSIYLPAMLLDYVLTNLYSQLLCRMDTKSSENDKVPSVINGNPIKEEPGLNLTTSISQTQQQPPLSRLDQASAPVPSIHDSQDPPKEEQSNPWAVRNVLEFLYYNCPECPYKASSLPPFENHAIENHPRVRLSSTANLKKANDYFCFRHFQGKTFFKGQAAGTTDALDFVKSEGRKRSHQDASQEPDDKRIKKEGSDSFITEDDPDFDPVGYLDDDSGRLDFDDDEGLAGVVEWNRSLDSLSSTKGMRQKYTHRIPDQNGDYHCKYEYCGFKDRNKQRVMNHEQSKAHRDNPRPKVHQCDECEKAFVCRAKLTHHKNTKHSDIGMISCEECGTKFTQPRSLRRHLANNLCGPNKKPPKFEAVPQNEKGEYYCEECDYVSKTRKNVKCHVAKKHKEKTFQCEYCPKAFPFKSQLEKHFEHNHCAEKGHICDQCGTKFTTRDTLKKHVDVGNCKVLIDKSIIYECDKCEVSTRYDDLKGYIRHYRLHHKAFPSNIDSSNLNLFHCDECGDRWVHKALRDRHVRTEHQGRDMISIKHKKYPKKVKCQHCDHMEVGGIAMTEHVKKVHLNDTPHACDDCDKTFGTFQFLQRHIRSTHTMSKCEICPVICNNRANLRIHKFQTHDILEEGYVKCHLCPSFFKSDIARERHLAEKHKDGRIITQQEKNRRPNAKKKPKKKKKDKEHEKDSQEPKELPIHHPMTSPHLHQHQQHHPHIMPDRYTRP